MKKNYFTAEQAYTLHQKLILSGFWLPSFVIFLNLIKNRLNLLGYLIAFGFLFLAVYLFALCFSKRALLQKNQNLYRAKLFYGIVLVKKKIKLENRPVVSILKFKKSLKFAFLAAASPDEAYSFNSYEIFILNEKHTKRDSLLYFKNEENAKAAINFLTANFALRNEIFSPNFS